jgi:hypothetical protein
MTPATEHAIDLPVQPGEALRAVGSTAEEWGADFEPRGSAGGELQLPVLTGVRRGLLSGPLTVEALAQGSRVVFKPVVQQYHVERTPVLVLLLAAAGALLAVAWPFFPKLLPAAPVGMVLAFSGWFLAVWRRRGKGPAEFLELIKALSSLPRSPAGSPASADHR